MKRARTTVFSASGGIRLCTLLLAGAFHPAQAGLLVTAPPELSALEQRIEALDASQFSSLEELTGASLEGLVAIELVPENAAAARSTPHYIAGYASGNSIVLFPARAETYPNSGLDELLRHELTHVLIFRAAGNGDVPRWFHEGLATLAATNWSMDDRVILSIGVISGGDRTLDQVEQGFYGEPGRIRRSYAVSFAFVRELALEHGREAPSEILRRLREGESFRQAWVATTGETLHVSEEKFWERRAIWNQWVPILTSSVFLWALVTLLAMWAMGWRRRRNRRILARWEDEEQAQLRALLARLPRDEPDEEIVN